MAEITEIDVDQLRRRFMKTYFQSSTRGKCVAHLALICIGRHKPALARQLIELVGVIAPCADADQVDLDLVDTARMVLPEDEYQIWGLFLVEVLKTGNRKALRKVEGILRGRITQ